LKVLDAWHPAQHSGIPLKLAAASAMVKPSLKETPIAILPQIETFLCSNDRAADAIPDFELLELRWAGATTKSGPA
jgi:hypothetical protein